MNAIETTKGKMTITSFGATGGLVTGSCHICERGDNKISVDFGMFQGRDEILNEEGKDRNFDSISTICRGTSDVLLTHPHIDHIGRLPMLFKNGFSARIYATEETREFMETMLADSCKIQNRKKHKEEKLYDYEDMYETLKHVKVVSPMEEIHIGNRHSKLTAQFLRNGHILGSSSIIIRDSRLNKNILFTGDMGKPDQQLDGGTNEHINSYPDDRINVIVLESTCFEKSPVSFDEKRWGLMKAIKETWDRGGVPMVTSLSFHREQEIGEIIYNFQKNGEIPNDCRIFVDAPLAMKLTSVFKRLGPAHLTTKYGDIYDFYKSDEESMARFDLKNVTIIESHEESKMNDKFLANYQGKAILIASGGMMAKGRSRVYLDGEFNLNPKNSVITTCFQVPGTTGAELLDKCKSGKVDLTKAMIIPLEGFTSHISGPEETFQFLRRFNLDNLETVLITHGRETARRAMRKAIEVEFKDKGYEYAQVMMPKLRQVVGL